MGKIFNIFAILYLLILYALFYFISDNFNLFICLLIFIIDILGLYLYGRVVKDKYPSLYLKFCRPSLLFLFGFFIVNFQIFIDLLLGITNQDNQAFVVSSLINRGFIFSSISLVAYLFGYVNFKVKPLKDKVAYENIYFSKTVISFFSILSLLCLILFLYQTGYNDLINGAGYKELGNITEDTTNRSEYIFSIIMYAQVLMLTYNIEKKNIRLGFVRYFKQIPKLFIFVVLSYFFLRLGSGVRAPLIKVVLVFLFSYIYVNRQSIKNYVLFLGVFVGMFFISVLSFSRSIVDGSSLKDKILIGNKVLSSSNITTISPFSYELARSLSCNQRAINQVENLHDNLTIGQFQIRYIGTIFMPGSLIAYFFPSDIEHYSSAHYLTVKAYGRESSVGVGTTINADFYLDFGLLGLIVCMFILGCLFSKTDNILLSPRNDNKFFWYIMSMGLATNSIYFSRASIIPSMRMFIYVFIILSIANYISRLKIKY